MLDYKFAHDNKKYGVTPSHVKQIEKIAKKYDIHGTYIIDLLLEFALHRTIYKSVSPEDFIDERIRFHTVRENEK